MLWSGTGITGFVPLLAARGVITTDPNFEDCANSNNSRIKFTESRSELCNKFARNGDAAKVALVDLHPQFILLKVNLAVVWLESGAPLSPKMRVKLVYLASRFAEVGATNPPFIRELVTGVTGTRDAI